MTSFPGEVHTASVLKSVLFLCYNKSGTEVTTVKYFLCQWAPWPRLDTPGWHSERCRCRKPREVKGLWFHSALGRSWLRTGPPFLPPHAARGRNRAELAEPQAAFNCSCLFYAVTFDPLAVSQTHLWGGYRQ